MLEEKSEVSHLPLAHDPCQVFLVAGAAVEDRFFPPRFDDVLSHVPVSHPVYTV